MDVPQMFRAQVKDRCSLQYTPDHETRNKWLQEWIDPEDNGQIAKHDLKDKPNGLDKTHNIYRIKKTFGYRVFTNFGLDSIFRPPLGKNGIPFIPGSGVKGLFRRACLEISQEKADDYCGSPKKPGSLRFYGAFPVGDWAKVVNLNFSTKEGRFTEKVYGILDLVHPQQNYQIGEQNEQGEYEETSARAMISFLKPTLVFEFGSASPNINWSEVEQILDRALTRGIGGKTSSGYGYLERKEPSFVSLTETIEIALSGAGVASVVLAGKVTASRNFTGNLPSGRAMSEFRPHFFKASLRGHLRRLLGGLFSDKQEVIRQENILFGSSENEASVRIFYKDIQTRDNRAGRNPTYTTRGKLYLYHPDSERRDFVNLLFQFAYVMGGFGKSWRRASHEKFFPSYHDENFAIGCHWECSESKFSFPESTEALGQFLQSLFQACQLQFSVDDPTPIESWRESWHPDRLTVFSKVVDQSQAISLFHNENFKTTPAIGGRNPGDERPTSVSCVWHRMLPIGNNQYLEIVTIFHGDRRPWQRNGENQLPLFIQALEERGLELTWGSRP